MTRRLLCVSVDLDGLDCYHAIHGLDDPSDELRDLHYTAGLERHLDLFAEHGVHATLFAVGDDLRRTPCREGILKASRGGHEIANHTRSHPYDFSRLEDDEMQAQIDGGAESIRLAVGTSPVGFRAPGYHIDDAVVRRLGTSGYLYDASLLPSPPYYAAKLAVMGAMRMRGRTSRSIAGGPGMVLAPNRPYRMGASYFRRGDGLVEIPCTVLPVLRLPFIGTTLALAGPRRAGLAARLLSRMSVVSLEFHAIDMMGASEDGLSSLASRQPDLRIPLSSKRETFSRVLGILLDAGFRSATLEEAAREIF